MSLCQLKCLEILRLSKRLLNCVPFAHLCQAERKTEGACPASPFVTGVEQPFLMLRVSAR